jgi:hypothetical protein
VTVSSSVALETFFEKQTLSKVPELSTFPPIRIVSFYNRSDIPLPTHLNDKYLTRLEDAQAKAQQLSPQEAAKQFHSWIIVAENLDLVRQVDEESALNPALDNAEFEPLQNHVATYGKEAFPYDKASAAVLKAARQNRSAQKMLAEFIRSPSGRKRHVDAKQVKQQQDREWKRQFDANVRSARQTLQNAIQMAINKLRGAAWMDQSQPRRQQIQDDVLTRFCTSEDAARRQAGEKEKRLIDRQRRAVQK